MGAKSALHDLSLAAKNLPAKPAGPVFTWMMSFSRNRLLKEIATPALRFDIGASHHPASKVSLLAPQDFAQRSVVAFFCVPQRPMISAVRST